LGDWLGTGTVAPQLREFTTFKKARAYVRRLGLGSMEEWTKYCKGELPGHKSKPDDIPANPYGTYKDKGWISLGDWLGTGRVAQQLRQFTTFKKARAFARKLGLQNKQAWTGYCKSNLCGQNVKPEDIPADPPGTYKNKGWISWADWLGTAAAAAQLRATSTQ
jgi:hypothetical protein